jgi:hypothetical protein
MGIIIDNQYAAHIGLRFSLRSHSAPLIALSFSIANQRSNLISAAKLTGCLPSNVYKACNTPNPLAQLHPITRFSSFTPVARYR